MRRPLILPENDVYALALTRRPQADWTGARALMAAVLEDGVERTKEALVDLRRGAWQAIGPDARRDAAELLWWLFGPSDETHLYSLGTICYMFKLDIDGIRARVLSCGHELGPPSTADAILRLAAEELRSAARRGRRKSR